MNAEKSPENHNVDHEEIAKFEAVASRWWDLEGEFKPLHRINPVSYTHLDVYKRQVIGHTAGHHAKTVSPQDL